MSEHKVSITKLPVVHIGKSDVIFQIEKDSDKLGKLRVSKGTIYWLPVNDKYGYSLHWQDFNDVMMKAGTRRKYKF
jgi:hypothetical protein